MPGAVLLPYQQAWLNDASEVKIWEKSRRIGASWCDAADSALTAALRRSEGGMDCWYIGYNQDMAQEYIRDTAVWARQFHGIALDIEEEVLRDGDKDIPTFRINFASGFRVSALSSRPTNLRGKQGKVTIDEAAFHPDLEGLLEAAIALLMWGGRVHVLSTHYGEDNYFNELIQDTLAGKWPYSLHRTTLKDALVDGLYRRICERKKTTWTPGGEQTWEKGLRDFYGDKAAQELDCIPRPTGGSWLSRVIIESCMFPEIPVIRWNPPANDFVDWPLDMAHRETLGWCEGNLKPLLAALDKSRRHYAGEDFGRSGDITDLWPLARKSDLTRETPFVLELRNAPFRTQEQIVFYVLDRLPNFSGAGFDARGNGQAIAEYARQRYGPDLIAEVMLSNSWYREHMPRVKASFEDRSRTIPKDELILDDLRGLQIINGLAKPPDKHTKTSDGDQRHCDSAVALALAEFAEATMEPPPKWNPVTAPRKRLQKLFRGYR